MPDAADIGAGDRGRAARGQRGDLVCLQTFGDLRLQDGIGTRRTAAQVSVGDRGQRKTGGTQQQLDGAANLECVLQAAGALKRQQALALGQGTAGLKQRRETGLLGCNHLADVARRQHHPRGLQGVVGIFLQQMGIFEHVRTAAGSRHHQAFRACFEQRPPGVDVAPGIVARAFRGVEMRAHRSAAARPCRLDHLDAEAVEHAPRRTVDVRVHRGLHATSQRDQFPRVAALRRRAGRGKRRHLGTQRTRQHQPHRLPQPHRRAEQCRTRQQVLQCSAHECIAAGARHLALDHFAADVEQPRVLHARGACGFAGTAGKAAIEMQAGLLSRLDAFEHLLDQINTAARSVQFVTQQLIGRAGRGAEAAMDAPTQDLLGLAAGGGMTDEIGKMGFHAQNSEYRRPGLKTP